MQALLPKKRSSTPWGALAYLAFGALVLFPLLWVSVPPLVDFPDHLARMAVLINHDPNAAIATNYSIHWRFLPNLAMDLVVPVLAKFMPLDIAGRVFIAAIMAMLVLGTISLSKVLHGRVGMLPLCAMLFVYNNLLAGGLVNYLFGLGVALLSFSLWIASESWPRLLRLTIFAGVTAAIFLLHLFAFGVFGLLVGAYEAGLAWNERPFTLRRLMQRASAMLLFVPTGLLWLASLSNMGGLHTAEGTLWRKAEVWFAILSYNNPAAPLDVLVLFVTSAFLAWGFATRRLVLAPAMRVPIGAAVVAALLMPEWLSGAWGADLRLPLALFFVVAGATSIAPMKSRWPLAVFALAGCLLFGLRIMAETLGWRVMDRQFAEFRRAIGPLPEGARLLAVQSLWPREAHTLEGVPEALQFRPRGAYTHIDALAVIDRGAFVPGLFTFNAPVSVSSRNAGLGRDQWRPLTPDELAKWAPLSGAADLGLRAQTEVDAFIPCCYGWPRIYDFVVWIDFGHAPPKLPEFLEPWGKGSFFHIYRVIRPSGANESSAASAGKDRS